MTTADLLISVALLVFVLAVICPIFGWGVTAITMLFNDDGRRRRSGGNHMPHADTGQSYGWNPLQTPGSLHMQHADQEERIEADYVAARRAMNDAAGQSWRNLAE